MGLKIYNVITDNNIIYYIKEAEFRLYFNKPEIRDKEKLIFKLFKDVYEICQFNYSSKEDIKNFNNYY